MDPYDSADAHLPKDPPELPSANPYAAPTARIADLRNDADFVKASRGARLGAVLVDALVVFVPAMLVAVILVAAILPAAILPAFGRGASGGPSTAGVEVLALLGLGFIAFVAMQLILLHRHGQTIGKRAVGIRIVRSDGSRAGLARSFFLRSFVPGLIGAIPLPGPPFGLIDPLFIFGEEKRCVHDLIADTIVVDA